ncbi:hypothetical protein EV652_103384 [Kribbella steppae]|uniref:DUF7680 domain-containing protein n=1 Tax=Kribbella steppae TaxID=2512223 RepID=A0A4R2HQ76_9ACTN|nr:hypothetical protein EV652_103384 [Kribbella steppae]
MTHGKSNGLAARRIGAIPDGARAFRLTVKPGPSDTYGLAIAESYGDGTGPTTPVLTATAPQVSRVVDAVLAAVRATGHSAGRLAVEHGRPIPLDEAAGVRLALTLFASQPVTKHDRIRSIVAGVNTMSVEETYYWYAKCVGPSAIRARRALRILLADNKTGA